MTALCLGLVWGASLAAADNTGANNTAEKNPTGWRARDDRESKLQSAWEERHGASTSHRKRLHHASKRSQQERVRQQVLRDPFGEESAVSSGEIKQAPQTKPRHAWNSQAGRVHGKAFRLITEDDPQHVSDTRSKPEPTASTPTGSNFAATSRPQEVPVEFVTLHHEPAPAPQAERDLAEKPVEKPSPRNVENRSILVVGRRPQPTSAPTGAPTGPAEQSAPEPSPTDAEDPKLLGDRVPAEKTVEETTSDAPNEPPTSEPPASEPPAEEDRQVVQPAPREHKIPTRTNNLSTTIYPPKEKENTGYEKDCQLSREYLLDRKLADISLNITVTGKPGEDFPISCDIETDKIPLNQYRIGSQEPLNFTWTASGVCHKPLYFEEVQAERYGHTLGYFNQPFLSTAHFFCNTAVLPYKMGMRLPQECVYPLGRYRSGGYAPQYIPAVPISIRGGLLQAGGVLAAVFVLP